MVAMVQHEQRPPHLSTPINTYKSLSICGTQSDEENGTNLPSLCVASFAGCDSSHCSTDKLLQHSERERWYSREGGS